MKITAKDVKKINIFSSLSDELCEQIKDVVSINTCGPNFQLYKEGDTGDTMILIFQGQVEVSKNMAVKSSSGFNISQKPIIRLETSDPAPSMSSVTESTVSITKMPAFGVGEFSLVLDDAIRTANVYSTTDLVYGVLKLEDFKKIVDDCPAIGGEIYFEVAKSAVKNLATASQDISNLTQAFFYVLGR